MPGRASGGRRACRGGKTGGREPPDLSCRTGRRHGDFDATDAHANERTYLEQLETNGAAGRLGVFGFVESDAAKGV
jgi:hypothetical protein